MRLTWRDAVTTALTAGIVASYAAYTQGAFLPLLSSPRAFGVAVLVAGMVLCQIGAAGAFGPGARRWATTTGSVLGTVALAAAVVAIAGGSEVALAVLVWVTAGLWAFTTARHALHSRTHPEPPVAETRLEQHKDELPPRLNVG